MNLRSSTWKWLAALAAIIILAIAARRLPLLDWLEGMAGSLRALGVWGVVLYALIFAAAAMLCIPCLPLSLAGGFIFGTGAGLIAAHTGTALAAAGGFMAARFAGRAKVADWLRRSERFHFMDEAIAREGWKVVGLLRMLPLPFGPSNYLYGLTGVDFWRYLLATVIVMLPGNAVITYLGSTGARSFSGEDRPHTLEWVMLGLGVASLIALSVLLPRILRRHGALKPSEPEAGRSPRANAGGTDD
ncbi:MAG: TVP38/TMEM64 family protein [Chthoniobacter sp.]|uniref:TVP38/TMEM64 family protein n=1 Tax=Chthoniobacter sp. TaxID=2510640 RepID=UPI0032A49EDF